MSERDDNPQLGLDGTVRFQILHAARQLIAGQLGVIAASRLLSHFRHEAEPEVAEVLLTFVGIDSETDALPIGAIRCNWSPEEQRW